MKKLVYTLGTIAAVATPLVAVVSCGSSKGNGGSNTSMEVGGYPNEEWFKTIANNKIEEKNELINNGEGLGYRYLVSTSNSSITDKAVTTPPTTLVDEALDKFVDATANIIENNFQFFYIQVIDIKNFAMKSIPTTYLPRVAKQANETTDAWKTRVKTIYSKLIAAQKFSSSAKDIPVTAFNAPSTSNIAVTVDKSTYGMARIHTDGQRYPQIVDGKLPLNVIEDYISRTLNAHDVSDPNDGVLGDYETEFHMAFTNELYFSEVVSALHIYRDALPNWIIRDSAYVAGDDANGFNVPYAHLPQNPMNYDRMLLNLKTALSKVNFVHASSSAYLEWNQAANDYSLYLDWDKQFDANGKLTNKAALDIANKFLSNEYVNTQRKYTTFPLSLSITSKEEMQDKIDNTYLPSLKTPNFDFLSKNDYKVKAKTPVYMGSGMTTIGEYYSIADASQVYDWTSYFDPADITKGDGTKLTLDEKVVQLALQELANQWWSDGSATVANSNITYKEIIDSIKKSEDQKDAKDYAIQQLLEWSLKDQVQKNLAKWAYNKDKNTVVFAVTSKTTPESLAAQLQGLDYKNLSEIDAISKAQTNTQP